MLTQSGRLYLTVPCHNWLWSQADVAAGHFRRHTEKTLRDVLEEHFVIDYMSYFFRPLVPPQWLLRALPYRLGFHRQQPLSTKTEHGADQGAMVRLITRLLQPELSHISRGQRMGFGASCLLAAHRKPLVAGAKQ